MGIEMVVDVEPENASILATVVICILYCWRQWTNLKRVSLDGRKYADVLGEQGQTDEALLQHMSNCIERIQKLGDLIAKGAESFLLAEFRYLCVFVTSFTVIVWLAAGLSTSAAFFVGCASSSAASYVGIKVATYSNYRVTHECWHGVSRGYQLAILAGSVAATALVTIAVLSLFVLVWILNSPILRGPEIQSPWTDIAGYSFGVSSIGLFMRVGGGIYTKAADIGADLSGKSDYALCEDDYRNPACIADNVGDNVGGVVGIGADLFSSFAAATCSAFYISAESHDCHGRDLGIGENWKMMMFPMLITCSGLLVNLVSLSVVGYFWKIKQAKDIEGALKRLLLFSTVAETPVLFVVAWACLPPSFAISCFHDKVTPVHCVACTWLGLWSGLLMAYVTEYYTSHRRHPVRSIADAQEVSAATGIIFGLAVGYSSCAAPVFCLAATVFMSHMLMGPYGIALAALGMLTVMTMCLTIDAYDSIVDNATGIAEMSGLTTDELEGDITDVLGGAGAIGNGFANGVGALVSISLLNAFSIRADVDDVRAMDCWHFTGLLLGAMFPYAFSAITMTSVGKAANEMVAECRRQFPGIIYHGDSPNYARCITIATSASLQKLGPAGLLVIGSPIVIGFAFGKKCTAGLIQGTLVSGMQMGISMINTGGAWDNAKKYVVEQGVKGSEQHKNAVIGDTVGDPLKDVSGPSMNVLVNLCAITSFVFGTWIKQWSGPDGGPFWMPAGFADEQAL